MSEFAHVHAFIEFESRVKYALRFVHDDWVRQFLASVAETSEKRRRTVEKGHTYFRAQRGHCTKKEVVDIRQLNHLQIEVPSPTPFSRDRIVPRPDLVGDGRANPCGIACLYLAEHPDTAMAEVRPFLRSLITLAKFEVVRDLSLVDCGQDEKRSCEFLIQNQPGPLDKEDGVWGDVAHAFSKPVAPDEPKTSYVPTQILAEAFRSNGYDGIIYNSLLHRVGKNIALFDVNLAKPIAVRLCETFAVTFCFNPRPGGWLPIT
jgi:RES domain-containing protein